MTAPLLPFPYQFAITATTLGQPVACMKPTCRTARSATARLSLCNVLYSDAMLKSGPLSEGVQGRLK